MGTARCAHERRVAAWARCVGGAWSPCRRIGRLGGSGGEFANSTFSSNVADLVLAADHLRSAGKAPALLIGHSLGGAAILAAWLANRHQRNEASKQRKIVQSAAIMRAGVPPRLLGPYLQWRSSGHNPLIETTGRLAGELLVWLDRGTVVPRLDWPAWVRPLASVEAHRGVRVPLAPHGRHR